MQSTEQTYLFTAPAELTLAATGDMYGPGRIDKSDGSGGWTQDFIGPKSIGSYEESVDVEEAGDYRVVYFIHSCLVGPTVWSTGPVSNPTPNLLVDDTGNYLIDDEGDRLAA